MKPKYDILSNVRADLMKDLKGALKRRIKDPEDIEAHDDVEGAIINVCIDAGIPKDLFLDMPPIMEEEMFSGSHSLPETLEYLDEMIYDWLADLGEAEDK